MSSKEKSSLRFKLFRKARKHQNYVELYGAIAYYEQMLNHELFADNLGYIKNYLYCIEKINNLKRYSNINRIF